MNQLLLKSLNPAEEITKGLLGIIDADMRCANPLFLKIDGNFINKIAQKIVKNPKKSVLIGVCGESASGKTTLAQKTLNACLKSDSYDICTQIALDDYYHDTSQLLKDCGGYENLFATGFSFDSPEAFNLSLLKEHLSALKKGESVYSPEYDFISCVSMPEQKLKPSARIILLEGLFALNEELRDMLDIAIYVQTPFDIIRERWYKRAESRGKTGSAADMHFKNVNKQADKYIRPAINNADIVLSGLVSAEYIESIAQEIIDSIKYALYY